MFHMVHLSNCYNEIVYLPRTIQIPASLSIASVYRVFQKPSRSWGQSGPQGHAVLKVGIFVGELTVSHSICKKTVFDSLDRSHFICYYV